MVKVQMLFTQPLEVPMIGVTVKRTLTCHLQLNCAILALTLFYFPKVNLFQTLKKTWREYEQL